MTPKPPQVYFHIHPDKARKWRGREMLGIFTRIAEVLESHGIAFDVVPRKSVSMHRHLPPDSQDLHIVENGKSIGEGILNSGLAYFIGFWHLSASGIQADSPARFDVFDLSSVNKAKAREFAKGLRNRFSKARYSRFKQAEERDDSLPKDCIALFLQGKAPYQIGHCSLAMADMILAVANGAGGRPVVVKPHPKEPDLGEAAIAAARAMGVNVSVTHANVHDVLDACAVTVSVNSSVAMEGFLHRKPAILFGQTDFPSLSVHADGAEDFPQALETALGHPWEYSAMLYWYFSRHSLELAAPNFEEKMFKAFAQVGFPLERFGKSGPKT